MWVFLEYTQNLRLRKCLGTVRYVSVDSSDSVQTTQPILTKFTTNRLYAIYTCKKLLWQTMQLTEGRLPLRCQKIKDHLLMLYHTDANNIDKMWDKKALGFSTYNLYTLYTFYNLIICSLHDLCIEYSSNY